MENYKYDADSILRLRLSIERALAVIAEGSKGLGIPT
jgi:hypothetical protein